MLEKPFAERCNYWKTSRTSPDVWLDKTINIIRQFEGELLSSGYGTEYLTGRAAYMVRFRVGQEVFRITWPVLPTESDRPVDELAARRQAATMLFHDVKAKCVAAQVLGARTAFLPWMETADGRTVAQISDPELLNATPQLLLCGPNN